MHACYSNNCKLYPRKRTGIRHGSPVKWTGQGGFRKDTGGIQPSRVCQRRAIHSYAPIAPRRTNEREKSQAADGEVPSTLPHSPTEPVPENDESHPTEHGCPESAQAWIPVIWSQKGVVTDITYLRRTDGQFSYLCTIVDEYTK